MTSTKESQKERYGQIRDIVAAAIRKSDLFGLIASGAPSDEFDEEIDRITPRALKPSSIPDLASSIAEVIAEVLNDSFGTSFSTEHCLPIAEEISSELKRRSLLNPQTE